MQASQLPIWHLVSGFIHSMTKAAVGIWSKSSRGRRRLLSSAVVDMLTQTTPPNWHHMSARNSAPCAALWYVQFCPASLRAYLCPLVSLTYMHYVESNSTTSIASIIVERMLKSPFYFQMGLSFSLTFHLIISLSQTSMCLCVREGKEKGTDRRCSRTALGNSPVIWQAGYT